MQTEYSNEALEAGTVLQSYEILEVLGKGGFGITYLALDRNLRNQVALKEYFPHEVALRGTDKSVRARSEAMERHFDWGKSRFLLEAQILAQFRHPNIVRVMTLFEANNTAYMAMDFEKGESLSDILELRGVLEEEELKSITLPLLSGLEELHEQGFIHRDIKPENIVIRDDTSPVLIDFGSARNAMGGRSRALTTLLTPGYSPLEQYYSTSDDQGPWTDIYAFGGVLYRAISGNTPPESSLRTSSALSGQNDPLVPAVTVGLGRYTKTFLKAVDTALNVLEKDRPQNVREWRDMLFPEAMEETPRPPRSEDTSKGGSPFTGKPAVRQSTTLNQPVLLYIDSRTRVAPGPQGEQPGSFSHVVVISNDAKQAREDSELLAKSLDARVKALMRGKTALSYIQEHDVDLVICEDSLRDMQGFLLLHNISLRHRLLPVVLASAQADKGLVLDAISLGASGFLKRPAGADDFRTLLLQVWQVYNFYGVEQGRLSQARRLRTEGKLREAVDSYRAVSSIVEEPWDYYESGFRELMHYQYGRAMVSFKRAAKVMVLGMEAYRGLAEAASSTGDAKRSKALSLRAARLMDRYTRMEQTKQLFVNIVKNQSHIPNPFNTLGVALRKQGDYSGAARAYKLALDINPNDPNVQYNMARVMASNLEHDQALERVTRALDLNPRLEQAAQLYKIITGINWIGRARDKEPSPENGHELKETRRPEALIDD